MPVRVVVAGPVASVELVLDGRRAGTLAGPSWSDDLDLGTEIAPHELVARALSSVGAEVAISRQWLNLPRPSAEVEIVLERDGEGLARNGRLSWESLTGADPTSVRASFNGSPVPVSRERTFRLPAYPPEQAQLLTVELDFPDSVRARKDLVLGGAAGEQARTELTALPVRVPEGGQTLAPSALRGVLQRGGRPLGVAAVEDGGGILEIVRDSTGLRRLGHWSGAFEPSWYRSDLALDKESVVRFIWPRPATRATGRIPVDLFPVSHEFESKVGGLRWILTRIDNPEPEAQAPRFADAVAVAALNAYGSFRRRAVLLVLEPGARDASQYSPGMVRRFLANLRVPLFVWSIGPIKDPKSTWTEAVDVTSESALQGAFKKIRKELETQRIVWVEGKMLPQEIDLDSEARSIELVR